MKQLIMLVAAGLVLFSVMPAAAQSGTKAGLLSCNMGPTIGLIVGSHQHIRCSFTPDAGGAPETLLRIAWQSCRPLHVTNFPHRVGWHRNRNRSIRGLFCQSAVEHLTGIGC